MKTLLLSFLLLLMVVPAAAAFPPTAVWAVGAPTDNYTIPDLPTNDPTHDEKKPAVNYYLRDVTAQTKTSPASFIASFTGPLDRNNYKVVGERQWYLDIDINTPGWLYIYEYYPPNNNPSGQWVAYKWQLKQSGIWQIGPFNAKPDEPEGQHIYRIWFYGNGQWATTDSDKLSSLIYWAYLKDFPELKILSFSASYQQIKRGDNVTLSWNALGAESLEILNVGPVTGASGSITVVPGSETDYVLVATGLDGRQIKSNTVKVLVSEPSATQYPPAVVTQPPAETPSLLDQLSAPVTLISILSVIVIIILGLLLRMVYLKRWANNEPEVTPIMEQQVETAQEEKPAITASAAEEEPAATTRAKLILPGGLQINLAAGSRSFGRADLARALDLDDLCLISRTQFHLSYKDGNYWIEDAGSINGTMLNGEETRGKGAIILKDGDIIEPAGTIKIKFTVMEP